MEFLKPIFHYISITRPKNLVLIGITQWIIYHFVFYKFPTEIALTGTLLYLFILDTIIIAAAGYVINDIVDYQADEINKPQKTYIPHLISIGCATRFYYFILALGLFIAIFIGIKSDNLPLVSLYPLACGLLYLYSTRYKNSVLVGNLLVSMFVAFVPGIIIVAERSLILDGGNKTTPLLEILSFYMIFSFLVNLVREIIKDIEDMEGDAQNGWVTLPIKYGPACAKKWSIGLLTATIMVLLIWIWQTQIPLDFRIIVYLLLLVASPLVIIIQILTKTTQKRDFSKVSTILKWVMLAGLGALILISKTNL